MAEHRLEQIAGEGLWSQTVNMKGGGLITLYM